MSYTIFQGIKLFLEMGILASTLFILHVSLSESSVVNYGEVEFFEHLYLDLLLTCYAVIDACGYKCIYTSGELLESLYPMTSSRSLHER